MQASDRLEPPKLPRAIWGGALLLVLWGLFPFRVMVDHFPWKIDAIKWVTRSSTESNEWFDWVFLSTHFVGYRPVTAASFTLNQYLGGWTPEVYRLTDFALHAAVVLAALELFRVLTRCESVLALLPVLVLAGHPGVEETLPYLPRRSYTLACSLGLLATVQWLAAQAPWSAAQASRRNRHLLATCGLLVLALLSNEVAYVLLPMLPLLAWNQGVALGTALKRSVVPVLAALPCVAARFAILGWAGGYEKHYFAYTKNGRKVLRQVDAFNLPEIVGAAFDYVFYPVSFLGRDNPARVWVVLTVLFSGYWLWLIVLEPLVLHKQRERRLPLLLGIWILGYAVLFGLSRTWFWRQAYPMIVVLALLVGVVAHHSWVHYRGWIRWARLAPLAGFLVTLLWFSPMVRGMTTSTLTHRFEGNQAIKAFVGLTDEVQPPVRVLLLLPFNRSSNRNVLTWMNKVRPPPDFRWEQLGTAKRGKPAARIQDDQIVLEPGAKFTKTWKRRLGEKGGDLTDLMTPDVTTGLLIPDAKRDWSWVELH